MMRLHELCKRAAQLMGVSPQKGDVFVINGRSFRCSGPFVMTDMEAQEYVLNLNLQALSPGRVRYMSAHGLGLKRIKGPFSYVRI